MAANDILANLRVEISAKTAEFGKALNGLNQQLGKFGATVKSQEGAINRFESRISSLQRGLGALGLAFGVQQVVSFASEVTKLAGEAEGVRNAFDRLPSSIQLMDDLKEATGGTVSELNLMKRAVQASNFDISLQSLPKLLEFAAVRAQQTGQSVDYLVDSIVTGIGRKSPLILDNLGISASRLREEMNGVSLASAEVGEVSEAVGRIASAELEKMGGLADTAKTKTERLSASWENLKIAIGETANEAGLLGSALDSITGTLDFAAEDSLSFWEKLGFALRGANGAAAAAAEIVKRQTQALSEEQKRNEQVIREVDKAYVEFNKNIEAYGAAIKTHVLRTELLAEFQKRLNEESEKGAAEIVNIANLTAKLNTLNQERLTLTGAQLAATNKEIKSVQDQIKALQELGIATAKARSIAPEPVKMPIEFEIPDLSIKDDEGRKLLDAIQSIIPKEGLVIPIRPEIDPEQLHEEGTGEAVKEKLNEIGQAATQNALAINDALASVIDSAISGQQTFAAALGAVTLDVLQQFQRQALGAALAAYFSSPTPKPFPVLLLGAGLAIAAVKALFRRATGVGGGGGGGGGGGVGGGGIGGAATQARIAESSREAIRVEFGTTEFKFNGKELVAAIKQEEFERGLRG